jgi:biofilm PGA synthesis N-glycosyltransferase PgaC
VNRDLNTRGEGYVIISPVRDEELYIERTILSVASQSLLPLEWIIVNDGSSDRTGEIIDKYATRYPWIRTVHRRDRGSRVPGSGVMEAFYSGYGLLKFPDWEYIVKLDGDVELPSDYFEKCIERCASDPDLGMCAGLMYSLTEGTLSIEKHPQFHVRGPIKLYRRACWDALGGLLKAPGWDTVDEVKANMLGWRTTTFRDIHVIHIRPTGAEQGRWRDGVKNGRANYVARYHPLFMLAKCVKRLFQRPYVVGSIALLYGFLTGYVTDIPRVEDRTFIRYIRRQQFRRLCFLDSIWK